MFHLIFEKQTFNFCLVEFESVDMQICLTFVSIHFITYRLIKNKEEQIDAGLGSPEKLTRFYDRLSE